MSGITGPTCQGWILPLKLRQRHAFASDATPGRVLLGKELALPIEIMAREINALVRCVVAVCH